MSHSTQQRWRRVRGGGLARGLRRGAEAGAQLARLRSAVDDMPQALLAFDRHFRATLSNQGFHELFGLPPAAVAGRPRVSRLLRSSGARIVPVAREGCGDGGGERAVLGRRALLALGRAEPVLLEFPDGRAVALACRRTADRGWVATFEDVTARRRAEARAEELTQHDALTGLPNRVLFRQRLSGTVAAARQRGGPPAAVLCLDLDRFKQVNDTLGHPIGDALLRTVADRLRSAVRDTDLVARLGGDEFAVLQAAGPDQPGGAEALARRLVDLIGRSYVIEGHLVNVGASVGVAFAPGDGDDPEGILKAADLALYRAKGEGRGTYRLFAPEMDARMQARRRLELDLREALALRQFELYYQPQLSTGTDRVSGFEALLRWHHGERGIVSPADFIPLAEEIGLIAPIGEWVLKTACREAARWPADISIAVNLSPVQFKSPRLVDAVAAALAASGLPGHRLELEITEGVLLTDNDANLAVLHRLRALGVRVAMDDFGTGYSSLSYLRSFPFDKIKIDRSFVRDLGSSADCAAIVRAIAGLGASLGMSTTAEGVETAEQMSLIRAEGCSEIQGYLVSRPVPAGEVDRLIAEGAGRAAETGPPSSPSPDHHQPAAATAAA